MAGGKRFEVVPIASEYNATAQLNCRSNNDGVNSGIRAGFTEQRPSRASDPLVNHRHVADSSNDTIDGRVSSGSPNCLGDNDRRIETSHPTHTHPSRGFAC